MASTAEELASQAEQLQVDISYFRLDDRMSQVDARVGSQAKSSQIAHYNKVPTFQEKRVFTKKAVGAEGFGLDFKECSDQLDSQYEKF